jgi:hypothetical protein
MTPLETLLAVFGILIVGGTSYELYNETKSHHRSKQHRHSEKYNHKSASKSNKDFFGLFKKSRKSKNKSQDRSKKLSHKKSEKLSPHTSRKLFNIFKNTSINKKTTSKKLKSEKRRKHTSSMTSSEKRQYYLNKFKHNVHKTKKRRRRVYI